jgi:hypothetical protein
MGRQPDSDSDTDDSGSDSDDDEEPPELMGRPPELDDSDDEYAVEDNQGWRPSYSDSEDDEPPQKSYHAERHRTCLPTTRSKSRGEATPSTEKTSTRPNETKKTQQKTKAANEHEPRSQDESDPDSDPDDAKAQERFNNRAKAAQSLEPNEDSGEQIAGVEPRLHIPSKKDIAEYSKYFPGKMSQNTPSTSQEWTSTRYGKPSMPPLNMAAEEQHRDTPFTTR